MNSSTTFKKVAQSVRNDILQMAFNAQSAHMGGALSVVEILVSLYFDVMNIDPSDPDSENRDRLIFSKAHDAKALFAVLCSRGYFDRKILSGYEKNGGKLPGHSTRHCVPGVEASAGSLGHGLPMATGIAFAGNLRKSKFRTFCVISDGECDEGTTWESALFASHHALNNLVLIIDLNGLQGFGFTRDVLSIEPLTDKWISFGWDVICIDGHDFKQLHSSMTKNPNRTKPLVVIAKTTKGLGGPTQYIDTVASQYKPPTQSDLAILVQK